MAIRRPGLRIVAPSDQLTGVAPSLVERAARRCTAGDREHRALVHLSATLAAYGIAGTTPPPARPPFTAALEVAHAWALGRATSGAARKARGEAFAGVAAAERATADAVRGALTATKRKQETRLDQHADSVVLRYAGLAANYATGAALMTLDGVDQPAALAGLVQQVAGALAYSATGLGPARGSNWRATACQQAEWEAEREAAGHDSIGLAFQLFHEFLGGYWRDQCEGHRIRLGEFAEWAFAPATD